MLSLLPVPRYKLVRKFAEHTDPERKRTFWRMTPGHEAKPSPITLVALAGHLLGADAHKRASTVIPST